MGRSMNIEAEASAWKTISTGHALILKNFKSSNFRPKEKLWTRFPPEGSKSTGVSMDKQRGIVGGNAFAKTVCSICYEYLKPIQDDLQVISLCGHVFHELCLQQWFEDCTNRKKHSCPVCKQISSSKNVRRLYFQSIDDPDNRILARSQNVAFTDDNR
ncbi:hypothetical protein Nepgr_006950 [Nepenthes gracilis]|uniref:RING-type domain-containing protein n=1 Tax=Nepenthes gracilis TaxID=150966 RepID=A0AAD3S628_NEPGR|nr:hypothetical protein Nepgr_006950 [Nepenthes gracilis]